MHSQENIGKMWPSKLHLMPCVIMPRVHTTSSKGRDAWMISGRDLPVSYCQKNVRQFEFSSYCLNLHYKISKQKAEADLLHWDVLHCLNIICHTAFMSKPLDMCTSPNYLGPGPSPANLSWFLHVFCGWFTPSPNKTRNWGREQCGYPNLILQNEGGIRIHDLICDLGSTSRCCILNIPKECSGRKPRSRGMEEL